MAENAQTDSKSWWQTLPGVLTALAALVTAVSGLLIAVHQTGWLDRTKLDPAKGASRATDHPNTSPDSSTVKPGVRQIAIPENATLRTDSAVYKLVSGHVEPVGTSHLLLRVAVRMTNEGSAPANLWSASFRLVEGGNLASPANFLDEVVDARSSKQGDVSFQLPANTRDVGLQMGDVGPGKPAIQIHLP